MRLVAHAWPLADRLGQHLVNFAFNFCHFRKNPVLPLGPLASDLRA